MIEEALKNNYIGNYVDIPNKLAKSDYIPKCCAIDVEYNVFKSNKSANVYKASIMKVVNDIKKCTGSKELHSSLIPGSENPCSTDLQTNSTGKETNQTPTLPDLPVLLEPEKTSLIGNISTSCQSKNNSHSPNLCSNAQCNSPEGETSSLQGSKSFSTQFLKASELMKNMKTPVSDGKSDKCHITPVSKTFSKPPVPKITYFFERAKTVQQKDGESEKDEKSLAETGNTKEEGSFGDDLSARKEIPHRVPKRTISPSDQVYSIYNCFDTGSYFTSPDRTKIEIENKLKIFTKLEVFVQKTWTKYQLNLAQLRGYKYVQMKSYSSLKGHTMTTY